MKANAGDISSLFSASLVHPENADKKNNHYVSIQDNAMYTTNTLKYKLLLSLQEPVGLYQRYYPFVVYLLSGHYAWHFSVIFNPHNKTLSNYFDFLFTDEKTK